MEIRVTGTERLTQRLMRYRDRGPKAMAAALFQIGEQIMGDAKELVPVDTGALRASGVVWTPTVTPERMEVGLSFGGPAAPYALVQHEDLTFFHDDGQAKFLEVPFRAHVSGLGDAIAKAVQKAAEGPLGAQPQRGVAARHEVTGRLEVTP